MAFPRRSAVCGGADEIIAMMLSTASPASGAASIPALRASARKSLSCASAAKAAFSAVNRSGGARYALAFFCDSNIDWPVAAVPTCVGPDKPPKYPTTYYTDYMIRYQQQTYNVFGTEKYAAE